VSLYANFSDDTSHEYVNKYCHVWWISSFIGQNPTFTCQQLVMKCWHLDERSLGKWQQLQHCESIIPPKTLQGMTNNGGWTFSVGDTILQFAINIDQDN
jgi:hypothetical protein